MPTGKEIIARIKALGEDNVFAVPIWKASDIEEYALDEMDIELTSEEISTVLHSLHTNHDSSQGINWDVIESAITSVVGVR